MVHLARITLGNLYFHFYCCSSMALVCLYSNASAFSFNPIVNSYEYFLIFYRYNLKTLCVRTTYINFQFWVLTSQDLLVNFHNLLTF